MRNDARLSTIVPPLFASRPRVVEHAPTSQRRAPMPLPGWLRALWLGVGGLLAIGGLAIAVILLSVRATHAGRIFPNVDVAGVAVGGMAVDSASVLLEERADEIESRPITFTRGETVWSSTLREVGVSADARAALEDARRIGREDAAFKRLQSALRLTRAEANVALPIALDYQELNRWFDEIDRGLGAPPRNATVEIQGATVVIVPEVDGLVVDREAAREEIIARLENLEPIQLELPISAKIATIRAVDLEPAQRILTAAMSHPVQVTSGAGTWTLPTAELAGFLTQAVTPDQRVTLGLDRAKLAPWLDEKLGALIETKPVDAVVGWNGEKVVSVEESVDGVRLDAPKLAELVEAQFFGAGGKVVAPLTYVKPTIDSNNLGALRITTLLGSGQSNYSGSNDGRATNVAAGATLLNGTLVPPWGEFSFNNAIGLITEESGFVEAQVIDGENIGQDIGGGICQVSTTVFRAAYLAGLPITEWWPHRFRIGFYEYDGWEPGLDASILQPTEDPSTWADFRFENPSDAWMLVESWTDGVNVFVNIYGADLGYDVESTGPTWGNKTQMLGASEVVDDELDPGTVTLAQVAGIGEELSHYRVVRDRNGELLWERSFYTKYFPRGDVWKVSTDMKGQAPIDPTFKFPPLPPAGVDSHGWVPGAEDVAASEAGAPDLNRAPTEEAWTPPAEEWVAPTDAWVAPADEWTPPAE